MVFLHSLKGLRLARIAQLPEDPVTLELNGSFDRLDSRSGLSLEDYTEKHVSGADATLVSNFYVLFDKHMYRF